jgi:hypothetical protein
MDEKESEVRAAFSQQASFCRSLGSEITATVLDTVAEKLSHDTQCGQRLLSWSGDPTSSADNVTLRMAGGLHALARSGIDPKLAAAYRDQNKIDRAVADALVAHDAYLLPWLDNAPQTNEVGRAAIVMAGLHVAAARYPFPVELLELGSSAGLVLNLNHYRYDLGGLDTGDHDSPLLLAPAWKGTPPPGAEVKITQRHGVDLNPIDLSSTGAAERLTAYVWPDQPKRLAIAETAIRLAQAAPPPIEQADAASWTEARLAGPQEDGVMRILFHTIAFQYFPEDQQQRIRAAMAQAGAAASETRPFGWLSFEFVEESNAYELHLTLYPGDEKLHLANAHPHVASVAWLG